MIYIETNSDDVYYNFGLEYYFTAEKQLEEPVFLFWRTTPTLMVGKYQNTLEEINEKYAREHNINIVRRLSGGGTIYTDLGGWQFTFIEYSGNEEIEFAKYISPVVDALQNLGVNASFNGRNDLVIDGKKFSGNAQYKFSGNTVHHGSLLFDTNIEQMVASTTVDDYKIISKGIKSVRDRVTNISDHLVKPITPEEFKQHMISYIMRGSKKIYIPTRDDIARIKELAKEKFDNRKCKFGMNPKFSIVKTGRFAGGKIEFHLDVKKGFIENAAVFGDFFASDKAEKLAESLVGCEFEEKSVLERLKNKGFGNAVYGISPEEMAQTVAG